MDEWYTAPRYIEAAREVMGSIDLDPASSELANKTVRATTFYTKKSNGLSLPWYGNVWLNPPYGRSKNVSILRLFVERLIYFYEKGDISQAVVCTTADTDEQWWKLLTPFYTCFPDHHVYYFREGDKKDKHMLGTAFTYLGMYDIKFARVFRSIGPVYRCVSDPSWPVVRQDMWSEVL